MNNNINYAALSVNDIIFLGRNKDYGAYELRESYNRRIKQSLLGAMFLTLLACSYQVISSLHHRDHRLTEEKVSANVTEVTIPTEAVKPPEPTQPPRPKGTPDPATLASTTMVPARTEHTTDSLPTQEQLTYSTISDHTGGSDEGTTIGTEKGDIAITVKSTPPPAPVSDIKDWVENMPEYPGGNEAMMTFLSRNLNYPDIDKAMDRHGRVVVGFVIDEEGRVTNIQIVKGLSKTLDEESIRVVSKLKTFKPGMQAGHTVKVRYRLPINYTMGEDNLSKSNAHNCSKNS